MLHLLKHILHMYPVFLIVRCPTWYMGLADTCMFYGSFTLLEMDSGTDSDSDSKSDGYIALCRTCSHCTDLDSDPYSLLLYRTGIRVRLWQCKCAITVSLSSLFVRHYFLEFLYNIIVKLHNITNQLRLS